MELAFKISELCSPAESTAHMIGIPYDECLCLLSFETIGIMLITYCDLKHNEKVNSVFDLCQKSTREHFLEFQQTQRMWAADKVSVAEPSNVPRKE